MLILTRWLKLSWGFIKKHLHPASPAFSVIVAFATLFAGVMASVWNDNIKGTFLNPTSDFSLIDWKATGFWLFVFCWILLFWWRQLEESRSLAAWKTDAKKSADAVLALPSRSFFDYYSQHICNTKIFSPSHKKQNKKEKEDTIRNLLGLITNLAKTYDANPSAQYAANVMVFINKIDPHQSHPSMKKFDDFDYNKDIKRFLSDDFDKGKILGLLYLPPELSVRNDKNIDPNIEENFVLPIVYPPQTADGIWRILPGAPVSFVAWNMKIGGPIKVKQTIILLQEKLADRKSKIQEAKHQSSVQETNDKIKKENLDISDMEKEVSEIEKEIEERQKKSEDFLKAALSAELRCAMHGMDSIQDLDTCQDKNFSIKTFTINKEKFQLGEDTAEKIRQYYNNGGKGSNVKSFLSLPLVTNSGSCAALGTLNIHCDSSTFLGAPANDTFHRRAIFASVISSLVFDIAELTEEWMEQ